MNQSVQHASSFRERLEPHKSIPPQSFKSYNSQFDPLTTPVLSGNENYAPTYWVGTAGTPPEDDGPLMGDTEADIVIIGGGFTGLSTALTLAEQFGAAPLVLEANRTAWGCTQP